VKILLPDVNSSGFRFAPVDEKTIAYGLGAIKGTGEAAISNIVVARRQGPFRDLFEFCRRVDKRIVNRRTVEALIKAGAFDGINDHRASLMATLDAALASADQQARAANQNSLFDANEADVVLTAKVADVPFWRLREQLAQEKLSLGFYLGGHPFQEYEEELRNFIKVKLADLTPAFVGKTTNGVANGGYGNARGAKSGVPTVLAGIVSGLRLQQTRNGRMAVVLLDDGSATIEIPIFNDKYESNRPWIKEDELLIVQGFAKYDDYSGNVRVNVDELFDLASARSHFAQQLAMRCNSNHSIARLKKLLYPYREGKCPVLIHYRNHEATCQLKLGEEWGVTLHEDLLNELRAELKSENVKVVYG
jgi:DNA polymerase-3 subunit alpha